MIGILGGLGSAAAWGFATVCGAHTSRRLGPFTAFAAANLVALAVALPLALALDGLPDGSAADYAWAALFGVGIVVAFPLTFTALTKGRIGIVSPVISTDGAILAVVAVLTGEALGGLAVAGLVAVMLGIWLVVLHPAPSSSAGPTRDRLAVLLALAAAACFAAALVGATRADGLGAPWVIAIGRAIGVVLVSAPVFLVRRPAIPRESRPWVAANAIFDVAGFLVFVWGAREALAVTGVLSSQYALVPILYGVVAFRERLTPLQWLGVLATLGGVALVALSNA